MRSKITIELCVEPGAIRAMLKLKVVVFSFLCRRTGTAFRRAVLISVVVLGIYLLLSESISSSSTRLYLHRPLLSSNRGRSRRPFYEEDEVETRKSQTGTESVEVLKSTLSLSLFTSSSLISSTSSFHAEHAASSPTEVVAHRIDSNNSHNSTTNQIPSSSSFSTDSRILVLYDQPSTSTAKSIRVLLQAHRIMHNIHLHRSDYRPLLEEAGRGKYCIILCADMVSLYHHWERSHLLYYLDYVRRFNVTLINFVNSNGLFGNNATREWPSRTHVGNFTVTNVEAKDIHGVLLESSKEFYYLKTDEMVTPIPLNSTWTGVDIVDGAFSGSEVLAKIKYKRGNDAGHMTLPVVMVTGGRGGGEGFVHVLIGTPMSFWLTKLMLLEVLKSYVSGHRTLTRFGRKRWLMVDIDDIFLAPKGLKMTPGDVQVHQLRVYTLNATLIKVELLIYG